MKLAKGQHLTYCTNVHRGETWDETMANLARHTLAVRDRVNHEGPFGIGLWLSDQASSQLVRDASLLSRFRKWLDQQNCYVFSFNGFPFGRFHGGPVKDRVYVPDWTTEERITYTNRLFDLLAALLPPGVEGSVSSLPGGFKEFLHTPAQTQTIRRNIFRSLEHAARVSEQTDRPLRLALEPEPLCLLETIDETIHFFDRLRLEHNNHSVIDHILGLNYDTCHLAIEFEEPAFALSRLRDHNIKIRKLHLSSALKLRPTPQARARVAAFAEGTYLHQVVARRPDGSLVRHKDLENALAAPDDGAEEWRVHFHIPLHCPATDWFEPTTDHLSAILDALAFNPALCPHLEMETYTWEALPAPWKSRDVADQIAAEYAWTLDQLEIRGLR